jgi:transposase InsO family protein
MDYANIAALQTQDAALVQQPQTNPHKVALHLLAPKVHFYRYQPQPGGQWKIYPLTGMLRDTVPWYHVALGHVETARLVDTLRMNFIIQDCKTLVNQEWKNVIRVSDSRIWVEGMVRQPSVKRPCCLGTMLLLTLSVPGHYPLETRSWNFSALAITDMVTNLVEVIRIDNKSAAHVAMNFENTWLSRNPRPMHCIHDQGGEFTGFDFRDMLDRHGIVDRPTRAKNLQANSVCERMYQAF